jgi:hypothetical protein
MIPTRYHSTSLSVPLIYSTSHMRGLIWKVAKDLLERLVTKMPFELTFVNNPETGIVEVNHEPYLRIACLIAIYPFNQSRTGLARMMTHVVPHGELQT